jgi:hypothetical protein
MNVMPPIVVRLGGARNEHIGALRSGAGPIIEDIEEVMRLVRRNPDLDAPNRIFLPLVVVYEGT